MILDRNPFVYVWRPFYRIVFLRLLWPLLRNLGGIATQPLAAEVKVLQIRLEQVQQDLHRLQEDNDRLRASLEQEAARQWNAVEQLLVCVLRERGTDA